LILKFTINPIRMIFGREIDNIHMTKSNRNPTVFSFLFFFWSCWLSFTSMLILNDKTKIIRICPSLYDTCHL
jgi:hypothetical protein